MYLCITFGSQAQHHRGKRCSGPRLKLLIMTPRGEEHLAASDTGSSYLLKGFFFGKPEPLFRGLWGTIQEWEVDFMVGLLSFVFIWYLAPQPSFHVCLGSWLQPILWAPVVSEVFLMSFPSMAQTALWISRKKKWPQGTWSWSPMRRDTATWLPVNEVWMRPYVQKRES